MVYMEWESDLYDFSDSGVRMKYVTIGRRNLYVLRKS